MKYFILIMGLLYLWGTGKQLTNIGKFKTTKDTMDNMLIEAKVKTETDKTIIIVTLCLISIIPLLFMLYSAIYVNTFIFAIVCFAYAAWELIDMTNVINYIKTGTISKTFDSRSYKLISMPFDLAFAIFILYQVFIKW